MYKVITGKLEARTAIHLGSGQGNDLTDSLVRRNAQGQPFIPGTSIAGALRALLTRLAPRIGFGLCKALDRSGGPCNCGACHLFGDINPSEEPDSESRASRVLIFDTFPAQGEPQIMIRDGVGIDRKSGAAARAGAVKFDLETVAAGSVFELRMELVDSSPEDEKLLAAGLAEWQAGRFWLGGQVGRGLGAFTLSNLEYKTLGLDTPAQVLSFLKSDDPWQIASVQPDWLQDRVNSLDGNRCSFESQPNTVARGWFLLTGILQADGAVLANDILTAGVSGFDHAPMLAHLCDWKTPVLTGAGLRGVLRSHAERLVRTLVTLQASGKEDFLKRCPACDPNVRDRIPDRRLPLESCDSLLRKAEKRNSHLFANAGESEEAANYAESVCLACRLFGSPRQGSRLIVEDAPYHPAQNQTAPVYKMLDFLAIDRFTGGGADGFKFDALALWQPAFCFRLYLENPEPWELGWLWLVLRDLMEGWLRVGFGGSKGFGQVRLTDWRATFGYILSEDMLSLLELGLAEQKDGVYKTVQISESTKGWGTVLQKWIGAFHAKISCFSRPAATQMSEDTYFGLVDEVYPVQRGGAQ